MRRTVREELYQLNRKLDFLIQLTALEGDMIMSTLDEVIAEAADETTVIGGLGVFVDGLAVQIADLKKQIADGGLDTTKVDALLATMKANKAGIADAITRNTPAEETPVEEPPAEPELI